MCSTETFVASRTRSTSLSATHLDRSCGSVEITISEIIVSTLPETSSKWVADKLVERVQSAANKPVEHIESAPVGAEA